MEKAEMEGCVEWTGGGEARPEGAGRVQKAWEGRLL